MTNTEAGLLDDIIANPADDVPRLIYADWLEDHGQDERAEFIRVQIDEMTKHTCKCAPALFVSPGCPTCKLVKPMRSRNRSLLTKLADAFRPQVPWSWSVSIFTPTRDTPRSIIRRGFLAEVHAPLSVLREHLPRLVREQPLEAVRATNREPLNLHNRDLSRFRFAKDFGVLIGSTPHEHMYLPEQLWNYMPSDMDGDSGKDTLGLDYPTADAAHAALSVALLTWAKAHPLTRLEG